MSEPSVVTGRRVSLRGFSAAAVLGFVAVGLWVWKFVPTRLDARPALVAALGARDSAALPLAISPNGTRLVAAVRSPVRGAYVWRLVLRDIPTRRLLADVNLPLPAYLGAYSPDGSRVAVVNQGPSQNAMTLTVFDAARLTVLCRSEVKRPQSLDLRFSRDGSRLNLIAGDPFHRPSLSAPWEVRSWDAATWKEQPVCPIPLPPFEFVAFCPDSRTVAAATSSRPGVTLHDIETGAVSGTLPTPAGIVLLIASPDGRMLAVCKSSGAVEVWDLPSRRLRTILRGHSPGYASVFYPQFTMFASDGRTLVSTGFDQTTPNRLTRALRDVAARFRTRGVPANAPPEVVIWDVATGRVRWHLYGNVARILSPDARRLATLDDGSKLNLWDLTGTPGDGSSSVPRP